MRKNSIWRGEPRDAKLSFFFYRWRDPADPIHRHRATVAIGIEDLRWAAPSLQCDDAIMMLNKLQLAGAFPRVGARVFNTRAPICAVRAGTDLAVQGSHAHTWRRHERREPGRQ